MANVFSGSAIQFITCEQVNRFALKIPITVYPDSKENIAANYILPNIFRSGEFLFRDMTVTSHRHSSGFVDRIFCRAQYTGFTFDCILLLLVKVLWHVLLVVNAVICLQII